MLPAPPEASARAVTSSISSRTALAGALLLGGALAFGVVALQRGDRAAAGADARARASLAVGLSAGAGLRGVVSIDLDAFRRGLLDGLDGHAAREAVMSRPERFERMRDVLRRLGEAEIAEVAERLDQERDS